MQETEDLVTNKTRINSSQLIEIIKLIINTFVFGLKMVSLILTLIIPTLFLVVYSLIKLSYSIWWKPKWLEKQLKLQGIKGTPYNLLIGDMKEWMKQVQDAWSTPINLNHQIAARVDPFTNSIVQKYGM